jgi:trehalose-phosphatase
MHHYKAIILDLDGVITRTAKTHAKAWQQMFDRYLAYRKQKDKRAFKPFDIKDDYYRYVDGKPRYDGVRSFLQSRSIQIPDGYPSDTFEDDTVYGLGNYKNELFRKIINTEGVEVFQDTVQMIHQWRAQGIKTAVVSSSKNCKAIIEAARISHLFETRVDGLTAEQAKLKGKPAPDIFLYAAEQLNVNPAQAIVVEDAVSGVEAGRRGHFGLVIGLANNEKKRALLIKYADVVTDSLHAINLKGHQVPQGKPSAYLYNALEHFSEIRNQLKNRQPALFLDYDGTLTPIVQHPEMAVLSSEMRQVLQQLASLYTLAIISGRDLTDVKNLVALDNLIYAGSHGFDIIGPGGLQMQHEEGKKSLPSLEGAERTIHRQLDTIGGIQIERKKFAVTVHYRNVNPNNVGEIQQTMDEILKSHPDLQKSEGKKIIEFQPNIEWHKGKAVFWLLRQLGLDLAHSVPIYIGDDLTDENAFRALSKEGVGILVGDHGQETAARYRLKNVAEVKLFLEKLCTMA